MVPYRRCTKQLPALSTDYFSVSNIGIAKLLNISKSSASRYKNIAKRAEYIKIKKNYVKTDFSGKHLSLYKKAYPDDSNKVRIYKGKLYLQDMDLIKCNITFTKRKKLEPLFKEIDKRNTENN